jgi:mannosyltransferase OCH1-like enzyme
MFKNKIPKIVHQTFCTMNLPDHIKEIMKKNKQINPDYTFLFYNDSDCDLFIKNNFDEYTYKAYTSINPCYGAMKSDFFRYCILYKLGGVYLDIKSSIRYPLHSIIHKNDICLLDVLRNNYESYRTDAPTYEQWILFFAPGHPYLKEVIITMVTLIHQKYDPPTFSSCTTLPIKQKILHITGPDMFSACIKNYIKKNKVLHRTVDYTQFFDIMTTDYKEMYTINGKVHYSECNESFYL